MRCADAADAGHMDGMVTVPARDCGRVGHRDRQDGDNISPETFSLVPG